MDRETKLREFSKNLINEIGKSDSEAAKLLKEQLEPRLFSHKVGADRPAKGKKSAVNSKKRKRDDTPEIATTSTARLRESQPLTEEDAQLLEQIQEKKASLEKLLEQVTKAREEAPAEIRDTLERAAKRRKLALAQAAEVATAATSTTTTTTSTTSTPRKGSTTPSKTPKKTPSKKLDRVADLDAIPSPTTLLKEAAEELPATIGAIKAEKRKLDELDVNVSHMLEASKVKLRKIEEGPTRKTPQQKAKQALGKSK